jgi:hypothetical protein
MVNMTPITLVFNTMATMVNVVLQCLVSQLITGEPHIVAYLVVPPQLSQWFLQRWFANSPIRGWSCACV